MSILISSIDEIYTLDEEKQRISNGHIIIEDNKIREIGTKKNYDHSEFEQIIDGKGKIALPGLVNTHTHAAMTLLRGYADDLPLETWLQEKIWPFEARLTAGDIYWGSMLAVIEMIKTGTTTFSDMYFQMDKVGKVVKETGIRAVLSQGLIESNDGQEGLLDAVRFTRDWQGEADGRITTMMGPHAVYTCSPEYLTKIKDFAAELDVPVHIHLAETRNEVKIIKREYNCTPVELLKRIDFFDRPVLAAHCVHIAGEELDLLAEKGVSIAHNPMSNMKLSSGVAPVIKMLKRGINVSLGSDGVSSNNNLDLIEEARFASYLQKVTEFDPTVMNIEKLLQMLTINGAEALHLKKLGRIEEDYMADLILVDVKNNVSYYPHHHNLSNLLYAGSGRDVSDVVVDGKVLMKDNKLLTIDEVKVYYEIRKIVKRLTR